MTLAMLFFGIAIGIYIDRLMQGWTWLEAFIGPISRSGDTDAC